ncbi:hypothetical protein [Actinoplanes sp. HUAS TT8]|uniref:hypothetical protein n=1 Tax=Actinoplanes sp. HUAS TT8 TaxID=3447453 RepID=UPI003F523C4A
MTLLVLVGAVTGFRQAVQRFEVDVDRDGWKVRIGRYRRDVRWPEISAVVLEDRTLGGRSTRVVLSVYLVPEAGVDLGAPSDLLAAVGRRSAVRLFDLEDLEVEEEQFLQEIADLAGDRLDNRSYRLNRARLHEDAARIVLKQGKELFDFPAGAEGVRTRRWLNRQRFQLFVGWYLFALVPVLLLTGLAARLSELLGAVVAALGLWAVVKAYARFVMMFSGATDLVENRVAVSGTEVVRVLNRSHRHDLHGGRAVVLPPRTRRGYGKAWLLGFPQAGMLLGDPRTGRLRDQADLYLLSAVLHESPYESDRYAARKIDDLAVQSQVADPVEPGGGGDARLWIALTRTGRAVAWAVVVGSILLTGAWLLDSTRFLGTPVLVLGLILTVLWAFYALYRIFALLGALWRVVRGNDRPGSSEE